MLSFIFIFLALAGFTQEISFQEQIEIEAPIEEVFSIAGNAANDSLWRTEVHSIEALGEFAEGTVYIEDAFLGWHYNYITKVELKSLKPPFLSSYCTTYDNPYKLKSIRAFLPTPTGTLFTYTVFVEEELIYDILYFQVPVPLAERAYKALMKSYLRRLKKILEHNHQ